MISMIDIHTDKKGITCLLITFLLLQTTVSVRAFNLRKINDAENLSSSHIFSIHQDGKGLMWIGTGRGEMFMTESKSPYTTPSMRKTFSPVAESTGLNKPMRICSGYRLITDCMQ